MNTIAIHISDVEITLFDDPQQGPNECYATVNGVTQHYVFKDGSLTWTTEPRARNGIIVHHGNKPITTDTVKAALDTE